MREDAAEGEARSRILPREWRRGLSALFAGEFGGDDTGFLLVLEPVAFALDVDGGRVVQQPVEDGRIDHVVGEDRAPVAVALVGGEDDGPLLIAFRDQLKQAGGGERIERQIAHLVEDEQLGLDQQTHPFLQLVLVAGALELRDEVLDGDEVDRRPGDDGLGAKRDRKMRLAHAGRY
jgi:hypothetical protein